MNQPHKPQVFGPTVNRIADVMAHTDEYAFHGVSRLARDARVSASSVSRIINGLMDPRFLMVAKITTALEKALGRKIDPRELVAESGNFPTEHICKLVGCKGCYPSRAFDQSGQLKCRFCGVKKGQWVTSRFPTGFELEEGGMCLK